MSNSSNAPEPSTSTASTSAPTPPPAKRATPQSRKPRKRPLARVHDRPVVPTLLDTKEAAEALRCSVEALRARLRRAEKSDGTAPLGPGIVGVKMGANTWRVRFDAK